MAVVKNLMTRVGMDASGMRRGMKRTRKDVSLWKKSMMRAFTILKIGIAAAMAATVLLMRGTSKSYDYQIEQETKLAVVMRQRMGATDDMIQSVKDLTTEQQKLGVIGDEVQLAGAQQLATFTKQADSLHALIPAMNNLAAQQKGVNATGEDMVTIANMIGKVMDGQTSALTRVGISLTEADKQMLKFGTETEKAARLAQVITNNVGNMNEALAQTDAGKVQQLKNSFGDLREQIGRATSPLRSALIPTLTKMINILSTAAKVAGDFMNALFGRTSQTTAVASQTSDVVGLGDAYEEAGKKALGSVAGFDEINSLADNSGNGASNMEFESIDIGAEMFGGVGEQAIEVSEKIQEMADKVRNSLLRVKEISLNVWDGFKSGISTTREFLSDLGTKIMELKDNAVEKVKDAIVSFGEKVVEIKDGAIELIKSSVEGFTTILKDNETVIKTTGGLLLTFFAPALIKTGVEAAIAGGKIAFSFIANIIRTGTQAIISAAQLTASFIASMIKSGYEATIAGGKIAFSFIASLIQTGKQALVTAGYITKNLIVATVAYAIEGWKAAIAIGAQTAAWIINKIQIGYATIALAAHTFATKAATIAQRALNLAMKMNPIGLVILAITGLIAVGVLLYKNWDKVKEMAGKLWDGIKNVWDSISDHTSKIWDGIKDSVGSAIDWAIGKINNLIEKVNKIPLINISTINTDSGTPTVETKSTKINTNMPKLATGGITGVNSPLAAIVGDHKTQKEVVSPLDDLMGMIQTAVSATMQAMGGSNQGGDIALEVDGQTFARLINPYNAKEGQRIGGNMISVT